jgi:putative phage-type endonuclease
MSAPALVRLPVKQNTDEWLAMRRTGVTASDLPVLMGNRDGLVRLWAEKCGIVDPEPPDPATQEMFDLGHDLEPIIARRYTIKTGRPLKAVSAMVRHPDVPWAFASLDRVSAVPGERLIVELKWRPHFHWDAGSETVPAAVQDQVQWQMTVTGYPKAHVAVLIGGRVEWHEIVADRDYQDAQMRVASWFRGLVERRERPDIDGSESTRRLLADMYPADTDEPLEPSVETDALAHEWRAARAAAKAAADEESRLANVARAVLEAHPGVESEWYRLTWKKNKDSERTDWKAVAASYRALLLSGDEPPPDVTGPQHLDAIEALHTTTTEGARVLRPWFKDEESGKWL